MPIANGMTFETKPGRETTMTKRKRKKKQKKFLIPKQTNSEEKVLRKEPIYVAGIKVGEKGYSAIYTIRFEHDHSAIP
jgi:glycine cleavage system pyridoxal-binding protein P